MAKSYVKFSTPSNVQAKILAAIETAKNSGGSLRKGTNEVTKAVERGDAKLVVIAEDVDPEEVVMHLPGLCTDKRVPFCYVASKKDLGKAAGISVGSAAIAIASPGNAEVLLKEIFSSLPGAKPDAREAKPQAKADVKPAPKPVKPEVKPVKEKVEAVKATA